MVVDDILERNRSFARGRKPVPFPGTSAAKLAVVACYDPRIDGFLRDAVGLEPGSAFLLRAAGAHVAPTGDPIRSIAVAVYLFDIREVLVIGHTSCRMAEFRSSEFADAFRKRGVPREAFGESDLRVWAGAIADPQRGVLTSVGVLRASPVLPRDLRVTGTVLDDTTGELDVVVGATDPLPGVVAVSHDQPAARAAAAEAAEKAGADKLAMAKRSPASGAAPETAPARPLQESATQPNDSVHAALRLIETVRSKARLREDATLLRVELGATANPLQKLRLVEAFLHRAGGDAREVRAAVEDLRRRANETPAAVVAEDVARRLSELARED